MQEFKRWDKIIYKWHVCYYEWNNWKDIVIQVPYWKFLWHYSRENEFQDPISWYKYYGISEKDISNLQLVKTKVTELWRIEVILCTTEDECNKILDLMHESWLKWCSWETYKKTRHMGYVKKWQCYEPFDWTYAYKEYYESLWYTIYPASDFIQESKEECYEYKTDFTFKPDVVWVDIGSYNYWIWNKLKGLQPLANAYINWYFQWNIGNTIWITSNSIVSWDNTWETHIEEETYIPKRLYEIL